nr:hypothetical protein [Tanacetum cinerariifolium]
PKMYKEALTQACWIDAMQEELNEFEHLEKEHCRSGSIREMLHISPRVPGQSFDELPFEEEILDFLRFLGHSAQIKTLSDVNVNKLFQPWRSFAAVINKCLTGKSSGFDSFREAAPKPKASARRKIGSFDCSTTSPTAFASPRPITTVATKGKQPARAISPYDPSEHGGSSTDEGTEDVDAQDKGRDDDEGKKNEESDARKDDDEEEITKLDEQEDTESGDGDDEETENSEDDGNGEDDQGLRVSEEQRLIEEEEADELYSDVDINQGRGIQVKSQVKEQVSWILPRIEESVNAQLEAEVLTRSSYSSRTSYAVAADLTEMELMKILMEKMEGNKSIQRSGEQQNLNKALIDAYEADKTILESYRDTAILKKRRGDDDDQEGPFAGSNRGSKRQSEGGEPKSASTPSEPATRSASRSTTGTQSRQKSASESAFVEEPVQTTCQMDEPPHPVFETGSTQTWISELAKQADSRSSFNELLDTPIDFFNFIMNRLGVDTLNPELLDGPIYELMRGSCNSLTELEYHLEEVYKATMDQLDRVNPEGQQYPHNLLQPLLLISDNQGHCVIPFAHFINNDLEYLRGGASSQKYTTSVTKTKAADYRHIKWIKDLVPRTTWIQEPLNYDKHTLWGVSHWGRKHQQFYGSLLTGNLFSMYMTGGFSTLLTLRLFKQYKNILFK